METWGNYAPRGLDAIGIAAMQRRVPPAGLIRSAMRRYLRRRGPFDVLFDGLRLRCHPGDNGTEFGVLARGATQDDTERRHIAEGLPASGVFVDIGANCGLLSLVAARQVGPTGRVIAIEPLPAMLERLRFNLKANGLCDIVSVEPCAIGDAPGTVPIYVNERQQGQSSLTAVEGYTPRLTPMRTLMEVCAAHGLTHIDVLKIDVEGHEDRAIIPFLAEAPRTLLPRRILMEITFSNRWQQDAQAALTKAGYACLWSDESDAVFQLPRYPE